MSEGGKLLVEAKIAEGDGIAPEAVITVADTGFGIAETELCKIFLPFFSAKKGKGLGLGLPICERIVKNHGGKIEVESQPGRGTTFKIYLPLDWTLIGKEHSEESAIKISQKNQTLNA
jgi:signal transduction histidine kinase